VPDPPVHLDITSSIPHNSEREQDAEKFLQRHAPWRVMRGKCEKSAAWTDWISISFAPSRSRAERLRIIAEADRKVEGAVYAAKQGVV